MMPEGKLIAEVKMVMRSVIAKTRDYFESEFNISVTEAENDGNALNSLNLLDMTAIIGMGVPINLLIALSFHEGLINVLYERMTDGLDIQPDEVRLFRENTAGEVVNTILGHCTMDLQKLSKMGISLTPPVILGEVKEIHRMENAKFYTKSLNTQFGRMDINLVGPRDLFDSNLDYIK